MFIGREKELATLNGLYNSDKFEFAVIYGRRRVGKTALISHFIQDKKAIYFIVTRYRKIFKLPKGKSYNLCGKNFKNLTKILTNN